MNLSIVTPSNNPKMLAHFLRQLQQQSLCGIDYEVIIVQEATDFTQFNILSYPLNAQIHRQPPQQDYGAAARDLGILNATGEYVVFWDDDNLYYPHALATMFALVDGYDFAIARIKHQGLTIPIDNTIKAGEIDTMCVIVRREIAATIKWRDVGGRYSDYKWFMKLGRLMPLTKYTQIIIGEHL